MQPVRGQRRGCPQCDGNRRRQPLGADALLSQTPSRVAAMPSWMCASHNIGILTHAACDRAACFCAPQIAPQSATQTQPRRVHLRSYTPPCAFPTQHTHTPSHVRYWRPAATHLPCKHTVRTSHLTKTLRTPMHALPSHMPCHACLTYYALHCM